MYSPYTAKNIEDIQVLVGVLNLLPNPVYIKNKDHIWVAANSAFCEFLGYSREELIGKSDYDYNPPEQAEIFWTADNQVFETKQEWVGVEETTNRLGEVLWVESRKSYYETADGQIYLIGVLTDISELRAQKQAAEEAERKAKQASLAKSQFLANMSHEIRTPMNGIMGMSELLLNSGLSPKQTDFVNVIDRSGHALLTVINDILDFSKAESGKIELEPLPFNLQNCIEDVTALLASTIKNKNLDLLVRIAPDLPKTFIGDVGRIRQILTNIVGNAVKFTPDGHVLIDVSGDIVETTANLKIQVVDTGIGIAKEKLSSVFEKFIQADGSTTREYGGTGLGLSISKQLIELMDGEITVESECEEGTTFTVFVSLPIAKIVESPKKKTSFNIAGSKILIIDDNTVNLDILKEQFRYWKCKTATVNSAKLGLTVLEQAHKKNVNIDLIIVDYQMPEMNGEDFYNTMRQRKEFADIPVIMLSSVDATELRQRIAATDSCDFMTKPARSSRLYDAVGQAIFGASVSSDFRETLSKEVALKPSVSPKMLKGPHGEEQIDVLIAEDNEVNQIFATYVMEDLGLRYKIVPNGKVAIDAWQRLSPRIILMDISMPEMNGYEATDAIRVIEKNDNLERTPIIAATAHAMTGDDKTCLEKGMDDYISKPLSIVKLKECLTKWGVFTDTDSAKKIA